MSDNLSTQLIYYTPFVASSKVPHAFIFKNFVRCPTCDDAPLDFRSSHIEWLKTTLLTIVIGFSTTLPPDLTRPSSVVRIFSRIPDPPVFLNARGGTDEAAGRLVQRQKPLPLVDGADVVGRAWICVLGADAGRFGDVVFLLVAYRRGARLRSGRAVL